MTTETTKSSPTAMLWVSAETLARRSAFCRIASVNTARTTPGMVPEPPKMFTPPSRTAVTTTRVSPSPASARAVESREVRITPANDEISPDKT